MTVQSSAQKPESVAMRVLDEVAEARGVDPIALTPPLGSVLDPDALDALVARDSEQVAVEFSYAGCHVAVTGDDVVVQRRTDGD